MRLVNGSAPITTTHWNNVKLGVDNGASDGGSNFLRRLDTKTDMTIRITNDDKGLETCALTGTGLLLHSRKTDAKAAGEDDVSGCFSLQHGVKEGRNNEKCIGTNLDRNNFQDLVAGNELAKGQDGDGHRRVSESRARLRNNVETGASTRKSTSSSSPERSASIIWNSLTGIEKRKTSSRERI